MNNSSKECFVQKLIDSGVDNTTAISIYERTYGEQNLHNLWGHNLSLDFGDDIAVSIPPKSIPSHSSKCSKKLSNLIDCLHEINTSNSHITFMNTALMQCSLPRRDVKTPFFQRETGLQTVRLMGQPDIGLPYGKWARLLIIYVTTQIKQTKSKEIYIGDSMREFTALVMGDEKAAGLNYTNRLAMAEQAKRLFTTTFTVFKNEDNIQENRKEFVFENIQIAQKGYIYFSQNGDWESKITITEEFFHNCLKHSAPVDMRIVSELQSPFAIDIYCWLSYRLNSVTSPIRISWSQLQGQFCDATAMKNPYSTTAMFSQNCEVDLRASLRYFKREFIKNFELINSIFLGKIVHEISKDYLEIRKSGRLSF